MKKEKTLGFDLPDSYDDYFEYRKIRNDHPFKTGDKGCTREPLETAEMPEYRFQDVNKIRS
jgi:hypothetical protein